MPEDPTSAPAFSEASRRSAAMHRQIALAAALVWVCLFAACSWPLLVQRVTSPDVSSWRAISLAVESIGTWWAVPWVAGLHNLLCIIALVAPTVGSAHGAWRNLSSPRREEIAVTGSGVTIMRRLHLDATRSAMSCVLAVIAVLWATHVWIRLCAPAGSYLRVVLWGQSIEDLSPRMDLGLMLEWCTTAFCKLPYAVLAVSLAFLLVLHRAGATTAAVAALVVCQCTMSAQSHLTYRWILPGLATVTESWPWPYRDLIGIAGSAVPVHLLAGAAALWLRRRMRSIWGAA